MRGVWAKYDRGVEQLQTLHKELLAFGQQTHPYSVIAQEDRERGHHVFRLYPRWELKGIFRWGAMLGEIVHDLRSALDQLISQLVLLNGGAPDYGHSYPIYATEPKEGFAEVTRRQWTDKRGRKRHGPLFGVSDEALAVIEALQPYKRQDALLLRRLHALWNIDKHEQLVPLFLIGPAATVELTDATLIDRQPDRMEAGAYVVEITVEYGSNPHVDVKPSAPLDIAFQEGVPIVEEFRRTAALILQDLLIPLSEMFPEMQGLPLP
jgi:hypothetical protein